MTNDIEEKAKQIYEACEQSRVSLGGEQALCPYIPWAVAIEPIKALYRKIAAHTPLDTALDDVRRFTNEKRTKGQARSSH